MENKPPKEKYKYIHEYPESEQLDILTSLCNRMYIARHIALSQESMENAFLDLDRLFRTPKDWG